MSQRHSLAVPQPFHKYHNAPVVGWMTKHPPWHMPQGVFDCVD